MIANSRPRIAGLQAQVGNKERESVETRFYSAVCAAARDMPSNNATSHLGARESSHVKSVRVSVIDHGSNKNNIT